MLYPKTVVRENQNQEDPAMLLNDDTDRHTFTQTQTHLDGGDGRMQAMPHRQTVTDAVCGADTGSEGERQGR